MSRIRLEQNRVCRRKWGDIIKLLSNKSEDKYTRTHYPNNDTYKNLTIVK